jgi:NADH:ubiquinone oxidoreductase subunit 6 (subunit J)
MIIIIFGLFAAFLTIAARTVLRSLFFLIAVFIFSATHMLFIGAELMAIYYLVIYVGAILVIFLFVIMLTGSAQQTLYKSWRYPLYVVGCFFALTVITYQMLKVEFNDTLIKVFGDQFTITKTPTNPGLFTSGDYNIYALTKLLYEHYGLIVFNAGMLLFVAMLGTIRICLHQTNRVIRQTIEAQINKPPKKVVEPIFVYVEHD